MNYSIKFHTDAGKEYADAYKWYEQQSPGLGGRFEEEVEGVYEK